MSSSAKQTKPSLIALLKPYRPLIAGLLLLTLGINALTLILPRLISQAIDSFTQTNHSLTPLLITFAGISFVIFLLTVAQGILQVVASERVGRDLRLQLMEKLSEESFSFIQEKTPAVLLTHLTSDIDALKTFVAQAISSLIAAGILIIGSATLLLVSNVALGLSVLAVFPLIAFLFFRALKKVRALFKEGQETIDLLNRVIQENISGSSLIRVLNLQRHEEEKFSQVNETAKGIGLRILGLFAGLIPTITFMVSLTTLIILVLGGYLVQQGTMTLGEITAFMSYVGIMVFPIFMIGFTTGVIARATASYERIITLLERPVPKEEGTISSAPRGNFSLKNITLARNEKTILRDISFTIQAGKKTAILGPTAAGKTHLLYLLSGLLTPTSGSLTLDDRGLHEYRQDVLHQYLGFVFQDSIIFQATLRENIAFGKNVSEENLMKAIHAAELSDFIASLPEGLATRIAEKGSGLSGGQKQRIMLARALANNPSILLLDDFTARVDVPTEQKILENIRELYPHITLISVTQKISTIEQFDDVILLMEGELIAQGTHKELSATSSEYLQILQSQESM